MVEQLCTLSRTYTADLIQRTTKSHFSGSFLFFTVYLQNSRLPYYQAILISKVHYEESAQAFNCVCGNNRIAMHSPQTGRGPYVYRDNDNRHDDGVIDFANTKKPKAHESNQYSLGDAPIRLNEQ